MIVRNIESKDINRINELGNLLHKNYDLRIDEYFKCKILEDNKKIIGFISYFIMYDKSEIIDIVIDPLYRNKGYSKLLMDKVLEEANNSNCENITLEVNEKNKVAINLYESYGFIKVSTRKKYYNNEDGYLMLKKLR